jgi:hypothetical protein
MDYSFIIIPIIVGLATQVLKLLTDGIKGNFDFKNIFESYGGMPSAHTAFVVSVTTLVGLRVGFDDPLFAVALVFTVLIMRDAVAFRGLLGKEAKIFNQLAAKLNVDTAASKPLFRERMGHSVPEVIVGLVWGAGLTYLLYLLSL